MENIILNENCLDGILKLKNESVDLIVTDPPYAVGVSSNGARSNFSDNNLIVPFFKELFSQMERVLKHGGELYLFTDWRTYPLLYPLLEQKFKIRNCIVWDYEWIKAGSFYRFRHEFIIYCTNSTAIACIEKNRKYVGFEIDENIFNTACERVEDFVKQKERNIDLFQEVNNDPKI